MRADAVWYSDACRKRGPAPSSPEIARNRRPSRNGKGVRVYFAPGDTKDSLWRKAMAKVGV